MNHSEQFVKNTAQKCTLPSRSRAGRRRKAPSKPRCSRGRPNAGAVRTVKWCTSTKWSWFILSYICVSLPALKVNAVCGRVCNAKYASLWIHRGICWVCEEAERSAGRCPHRAACSLAAFCPHLRQCFTCTGVSCDECGMFYADGDDVQCLVDRFQPVAIYLDFDRTLCTTRGGGSPLIGNHSLDPGLTSVLSCAPETATVVTRNRCDCMPQYRCLC